MAECQSRSTLLDKLVSEAPLYFRFHSTFCTLSMYLTQFLMFLSPNDTHTLDHGVER